MKLDRDSNIPLYMQFKKILLEKIISGEFKTGSIMKTELELCNEYGISRYPVRQAMDELVKEGYLHRTRGKGTFVNNELPDTRPAGKILGLILPHLTMGISSQILSGFEKQARRRGYLTMVCCSEGLNKEEMNCVDMLVQNGAAGIVAFTCDHSEISSRVEELKARGIYLGLIDRDQGVADIDYIGSDNFGGAYSAVRHMALQGFRNILFVSDGLKVSSVKERLDGFSKAAEDFLMNCMDNMDRENANASYTMSELSENMPALKNSLPFGIVAVNDFAAIRCLDICKREGFVIGKDVAVVGFDNIDEGNYQSVPLTTIAQNGLLLGHSAADIAIDKLGGKANRIYRSIIPTQLVVRSSCGEKIHTG